MTTMIERVARAICEAEWGERSWTFVSDHSRNKATQYARAAIAAMREPDEHMIGVGRVVLLEGERKTTEAYTAMIDAALEEGE